jgi:Ni/Fe-hydrogenase subunit HybB-like protein
MLKADPHDKARLIDPLFARPSAQYWLAITILLAIIGFGGAMYIRQLILGLAETGMGRPVYWGIYMVNFIFLIGVSMAGTLISAALQLIKAEWRSPITRIAEALTVFGLLVAAMQIFLDMGKPERGLYIIQYGRLQSPLLWDATSLTVYLLTSMFALFLQLLPDIALLRDNFPPHGLDLQRKLYTLLALGWRGNREQWLRLEKAATIISVFIIPIGVSLHTVTSWIFSTTVQPGWKSTILGPYFVVGAIFSGLGLLFIVMALFRKFNHLQDYIKLQQFRNLSWLFLVMNLVWFYFTYTEHLTIAAEQDSLEFPVLASKMWGEFSPAFWLMVLLMFISFFMLVFPRLLPDRAKRLIFFQPRFAMFSAVAAAVTLFFLTTPMVTPLTESLADPITNLIAWILLIILINGIGMGVSFWLRPRLIAVTVIAGFCVVVAMWIERWLIIIPVLTHPRLVPYTLYFPTLTEISLTAASAALLVFMAMVFFKLFPPISIWEVSEQRVIEEAKSKIVIPPPEPTKTGLLRRWGLRR